MLQNALKDLNCCQHFIDDWEEEPPNPDKVNDDNNNVANDVEWDADCQFQYMKMEVPEDVAKN